MIAAANSKAGFKSIGLLVSAPDRGALRKRLMAAGAGAVIEDLSQLPRLLKEVGQGD